ncbi:MAG: cob(I)yrinic acid a,c-diamide adenosyltransferase [Thalassobaculum sp.]
MTETDSVGRSEAHRAEMKRIQAEHRARMKTMQNAERGLLAVHTGDGKGKSTAAFGTIVRALGWGRSVGVVQFIKGTWKTGENEFFQRFSDLLTFRRMGDGFTWDTQDRDQDIRAARAAWDIGQEMFTGGEYDLVVLDELNIALRYDYLPVEEVVEALAGRNPCTTVIVTGRDAPAALIELADLVTEMTKVKHPFDAGIKAARGFDF